jgi:hypothetical protein
MSLVDRLEGCGRIRRPVRKGVELLVQAIAPTRASDFLKGHAFNDPGLPATPRLMKRRGRPPGMQR